MSFQLSQSTAKQTMTLSLCRQMTMDRHHGHIPCSATSELKEPKDQNKFTDSDKDGSFSPAGVGGFL